jgi:nucleoside-diphosphate-sugar epimerase
MPITLLRPQEVAERYGVRPECLQALIESGALTPIQVGGEELVCEDDLVADIALARKELDYAPRVDLAEGLARTYDWLAGHAANST